MRPSQYASMSRRGGYSGAAYAPENRQRRYVTFGILGAGIIIALLVLLISVEQRSPSPAAAGQGGDSTIQALQAQLQQNPGDVDAMVELGNSYYDSKRYVEAIAWYEKAVEKRPTDTNLRTDLGTAYFYTGNNDKAKEQWDIVLKQDPNKVQAHFNYGIMYSSLNPPDNDSAAREWQTVIKLAPGSEDAKQSEAKLKQIGR